MEALLELAKLRALELVNIVGNTDETLALLAWLQEEADEAAVEDQRISDDEGEIPCRSDRIGGLSGEDM